MQVAWFWVERSKVNVRVKINTASEKNCTLLFVAQLCQTWIDFNNSFTVVTVKFLYTKVELNLPHHLNYVAALPCKCTQKVIHGLSNRTFFNDLEGTHAQISRSVHSLTLNISKMTADTVIVTVKKR